MKRLYSLIALLGLVGMLAGCDNSGKTDTSGGTNAMPAAPSTNAPAK